MHRLALPIAAILTRVAIVALGLALFFEQAGGGHLLHDGAHDAGLMTPVYWARLLAPAFFLWALWAASAVSVRINRGLAFGPAMVSGLMQIGGALMLGAFATIVVQPSVAHLVDNGFREMRGVRFDYTVENVTLALVGLMLMLLARKGQELKATLEEFV